MMMETLKTDSKKIRKKSSKYGIRRGISLCGCYDTKEKQEKNVAEGECKGYSVTSVTRICTDGSRPRVAVKSNPYYKKTIKEFIENF